MTFDKILAIPFKEGGIVKVLIGGILQIIPIVNFFSMGYIVECFANGADKREEMPEWTDWGQKFINGLLMVVIGFIYLLIPLIILSFTGFFGKFYRYHIGAGTFIFAVLLFIIFTFALPMAVSNFAVKNSFGAAFQFGRIVGLIGAAPGSYVGAYLLYFVAALICMVISIVPLIGWLFAIFAGFYLGCVSGFLFGSVYSKADEILAGSQYKALNVRAAGEMAPAEEKSFCQECGNPLAEGDRFCTRCGKKKN
ncbi:MAG: DUF4013 domain-containing protein [Eubacteriales bacterium]